MWCTLFFFTDDYFSPMVVVMFIREVAKPNGSVSIRIVETVRRGKKTVQKTIRTLGQHKDPRELEIMKKAAEDLMVELRNQRSPALPGMEGTIHGSKIDQSSEDKAPKLNVNHLRERSRVNSGIETILGHAFHQMGFDDVVLGTSKDGEWNRILRSCVLVRIASPESKRRTARTLKRDFAENIPLQKIYRMMDHLARQESRLKEKVLQSTLDLFNQKVDVMFFDVTTLYFESFEHDELRRPGFSKDCKFKETQVVLALVTNSEGHPVSYEVFPGNTYEGSTLINAIETLKVRFCIRDTVLVADRAMFTKENLNRMDAEGIKYVVAAKLRAGFSKKEKEQILSEENRIRAVDERNDFRWTKEISHNGRRLIISYSTERAAKDARDRQKLVDRLRKKLRHNDKINIKDVISNHGTKKYLRVNSGQAEINQEKIQNDEKWDGLHGVITNIDDRPIHEILNRYKGLWKIEQAFRINKTDLKMRPIFHWKHSRILAHIGICFMAYALICNVSKRIKDKALKFSFNDLRDELLRDQYSLLEDTRTHKLYRLPSKTTPILEQAYSAFGLRRSQNLTTLSDTYV